MYYVMMHREDTDRLYCREGFATVSEIVFVDIVGAEAHFIHGLVGSHSDWQFGSAYSNTTVYSRLLVVIKNC